MDTAFILSGAAATLIAAESAGVKASGWPLTATLIGIALGTLQWRALTSRYGKRFALRVGYGVAAVGASLASIGAVAGSLVLLLVGQAILGVGQAAAHQAAYVAADMYPEERRHFALSSVIWPGAIGAVAGALSISPAAHVAQRLSLPDLSGPIVIAGLAAALATAMAFMLPQDEVPEPAAVEGWAVLRRRSLRLPVVTLVAANVALTLVSTVAPPHLNNLGHGLDLVGWALAAYVFATHATTLLSLRIALRFGVGWAITCGLNIIVGSMLVVLLLADSNPVGLTISLFLLGCGWNLMAVGGNSMLPVNAVSAVEMVTWGASALAGIGSGYLYGLDGYTPVTVVAALLAALPPLLAWPRQTGQTTEKSAHLPAS